MVSQHYASSLYYFLLAILTALTQFLIEALFINFALDINECDLGKCSQICINTFGSHICECNDGFELKYGHCLFTENLKTKSDNIDLLFSDQNRIFKLDIQRNYTELIFQMRSVPILEFKILDFDYSYKENLLFLSEFYTNSIYM